MRRSSRDGDDKRRIAVVVRRATRVNGEEKPGGVTLFVSSMKTLVSDGARGLLVRFSQASSKVSVAIADFEQALTDARTRATGVMADQRELRRHIARLDSLAADWEDKARLALSKDREDLARAALVERQRAVDAASHLRAEVAALDEALSGLSSDIADAQARLIELRSMENTARTRLQVAEGRHRLRGTMTGENDRAAMDDLETLSRYADQLDAGVDALSLGQPDGRSPEARDRLGIGSSIDVALDRLKREQPQREA